MSTEENSQTGSESARAPIESDSITGNLPLTRSLDEAAPADCDSTNGVVGAETAPSVTIAAHDRSPSLVRLKPCPPGPRLLGAICILATLCFLQVLAAIPFCFAAASGREVPVSTFLLINSVVTVIIALALGRVVLGKEMRRHLAFRPISLKHLAVVLLLVLPVVIVGTGSSNFIDRTIWSLMGGTPAPTDQQSFVLERAEGKRVSLEEETEQAVAEPVNEPRRLPRLRRWLEELAAYVDSFYRKIGDQSWLYVLLIGCLAPAVAEEILFRGIIGRGLLARYGIVMGSLLTALLFGLMHLNPTNVIATALLSLILQLAYITTRSLVAPILLHFCNNLIVFLGYKLADSLTLDLLGIFGSGQVPALLFGTSLGVVCTFGWILIATRAQWVTRLGEIWTPGYVTAEMPPAAVEAFAVSRQLRFGASVTAGAVFASFLLAASVNGMGAQTAWLYEARGLAALTRGDYEEAKRQYTKAFERDGTNAQLLLNRGYCSESMGRLEDAIADYSAAIILQPNLATAYGDRGRAYNALGSSDRAIDDLTVAIHLGAATSMNYSERAMAHMEQGSTHEAEQDCDTAIRLEPHSSHAHEMRGHVLHQAKRYSEAIEAYSEAIRLDPRNTYALRSRAMSYAAAGAVERALDDINKLHESNTGDHHIPGMRANVYRNSGNWTGVVESFTAGLAADANCVRCLNGRAWLYATCPDSGYRNGVQAIEDARRACELTNWSDFYVLDTLAAAYAEAGDFENAVRWQNRAVELSNPKHKADCERRAALYAAGEAFYDDR